MTEGGDFDKLGRGGVWQGQIPVCLHQNHVFAVRPNSDRLHSAFLAALAASTYGRNYFLGCAKRSTNLASINATQLKAFPVQMPPLQEQKQIAAVIGTWDLAIAKTEQILANSQKQKRALASQLLSGKRRLRSADVVHLRATPHGHIPTEWSYPKLEELASEVNLKNVSVDRHPVLSCTKHAGLVDSLTYFNKQVFSKDLSAYKIVPRGAFAYATNHIEEGSIGYQDLYDFGLVSPMYTVFQTTHLVHDPYLYRLLKTEHFRQIFAAATNSSVDRRGSLRWNDFKKLHVPLPPMEEQRAIAAVLEDADEEISLLQRQLQCLRNEKSALMQQLLTGKRRTPLSESAEVELA
jgi:type I restriction enzyme S subunit